MHGDVSSIHKADLAARDCSSDCCVQLALGFDLLEQQWHVGLLAEAGVLEVVGEQRVHGAVERRYRLHQTRARIDPDTAASMSLDEHRHAFAAAMAALLAEFNTYLEREQADPTADSVGYTQIPLWLSKDELAGLVTEVRSAIKSRLDNKPAPDRRLHLVSPILFPIEEQPDQ
jgi:hypothetical protein